MLEEEEYWEEMRLVLGSTEEAAEDLVSFSYLSFSSAVLSWDSSSWILALAVLNFNSSSFSRLAELLAMEAVDLNLSISWTRLAF